jgi:hypothetical protein
MTPSAARNRHRKRRAWLIARLEDLRAKRPDAQTYFLTEEIEALDYSIGILEAMGGPRTGGAVADEPERVQRARDAIAERAKKCTCERCPVHSDKVKGIVDA